jgi:hypothetical protein
MSLTGLRLLSASAFLAFSCLGQTSLAATIGFDDVDTSIVPVVDIPSGHYASLGAYLHYGALDSARVARAGTTGSGAVSPPNALLFGGAVGGPNPTTVILFVDPVTQTKATTNSVSAAVGDLSGEPDFMVMRAYDVDGHLLGSSSYTSVTTGDFGTVTISAAGIYRVEFSDDPAGGGATLDNLTFGPLTTTGLPVPATSGWSLSVLAEVLLLAGAVALMSRWRVGAQA